jgi:cell division protein FtsL
LSAIAETPRVRTRRRTVAAASASRKPFAGGVLWIVVVAVLLTGIVAINVVVLQLNVQLDRLGRERAELKADNAMLHSQLSSASTQIRIQDVATAKLGLVAADQLTLTYVHLGAK